LHSMEKYRSAIEVLTAATIMAVLGLLGLYVAPLFFLIMLLLPLPLVYLILKRDLFYAVYAAILTTIMLMIAFGHIRSVGLLVLQFAPLGVLVGLILKNKVAVNKSMAVLFLGALLIAALNLFFSFVLSGAGIAQVTDEFRVTMEQMAQLYTQNGMLDEADRQEYLALTEQIADLVQTFLPGSVAVWNIMLTMATYFLARHWMHKLGFSILDNFNFTKWQLPWYFIWLIIIGLALTMGGDELSWQIIEVTGKNILYIAAFIFFVLGISVIIYYLQLWKISKVVKIIIVLVLLLYLPFTAVMALTIGIIDTMINLRRQPSINDPGNKGD